MKQILLIPFITLILVHCGKAQTSSKETDFREKFQFGLKIGTNYSNVYDAQGEEFKADAKFGLVFGGFVIIPLGKYIGIQPELLFTQKGFKGSGKLLGATYHFKRTSNFVEIPILFGFKPSEFITLLAGPHYSFLVKQRDLFTNSTSSYTQEQVFKQDNIRKNILGIQLGANINMKHITLGGRLGWDVLSNNGDGSSSTPRYKNSWIQATVGYKFY